MQSGVWLSVQRRPCQRQWCLTCLPAVFPFPYIPFQLTETFMIIIHSEQRGNALEEHYKQF